MDTLHRICSTGAVALSQRLRKNVQANVASVEEDEFVVARQKITGLLRKAGGITKNVMEQQRYFYKLVMYLQATDVPR